MAGLELILILLAATAALGLLAERLRVPQPVLLVLGGLALAVMPGLPRVELDPDVLFLIFVPPLLFRGAVRASLRDVHRDFWPIVNLGVVLVLVSIAVAAGVAHALDPAFSWAAAFALGATASPPDPIAATAVMRTARGPARLSRMLEAEGMVNDAVALVAYRTAVHAAVTGTFSPSAALVRVLLTGAGRIGVGLLVGWLLAEVRARIPRQPVVENTISLLTPFAAYLPAEALGASGVLAVVTMGFYLARRAPRIIGAATRLQSDAMWEVSTFILEGLIFILIGLELPRVMEALRDRPLARLLWYGAAMTAALIAVRLGWVMVSASFSRLARRLGGPVLGWRERVFIGWAGVRGGDSLVIALALPFTTATGAPFPARSLIIFVTFSVIFATLVLQGLSLSWLLRRLGLHRERETDREEAHARHLAVEAGLARLDAIAGDGDQAEVARYLRLRHRSRARRWADRERRRSTETTPPSAHTIPVGQRSDIDERRAASYRQLRDEMMRAERDAIITLRDDGEIDDETMRRIQRDLDLEEMLLGAAEPVGDTPQDVSKRIEPRGS